MLTTKMYSGNQDNIINNTGSVSKTMASEIVPENPALKNESLDKHSNPEKIISDQKVLINLVLKNRTDRKRPRKRRNYDPEVTSTKHVDVNQFAESWNICKRRTDQEIISDRQGDLEILFNMCREMVNIQLANPAEESFKLCNQEISQLRVSIELDIDIFEDKNDFFCSCTFSCSM